MGVRKIIYTTNAIESLHSEVRKAVRGRGHFPSDEAATKLIWLALRNITADWGRAAKEWREAMNQFARGGGITIEKAPIAPSVELATKIAPLWVAVAVSDAVGRDRVGIRLSPFGAFNDMPAYPSMEADYTYLAGELDAAGLIYIHLVDHSSMGAPPVPELVKATFRSVFKRTLILSGGYDAVRAADAIGGRVDFQNKQGLETLLELDLQALFA